MYLEQRAYSEERRCGLGSGNVTAHVGLKMRTKERLWISTRPARAVITISKTIIRYCFSFFYIPGLRHRWLLFSSSRNCGEVFQGEHLDHVVVSAIGNIRGLPYQADDQMDPKRKKKLVPRGKKRSNGKNGRTGLTEAFEPHLNGGRICLAGCGEYAALSPRENGVSILVKPMVQAGGGRREETHWYSGSSESKSTHSTPTSSRLSSTIDARSWSTPNSMPRKRVWPPVFGRAGMMAVCYRVVGKDILVDGLVS